MDEDLKTQLLRTVFQFKKLTGEGFGISTASQKSDINISEFVLMKGITDNAIDAESNVGMSDVRGYLSISKAAVSQMLGSLEKKGYINRETDKANRRNLIVTLTSDGRKILANKDKEFSDKLDKMIAKLGENDVKQMIRIVNRMTEIINQLNHETKQTD